MSQRITVVIAGLILLSLSVAPLYAQAFQLSPVPSGGHYVPPWFEGWYVNPDSSRTFSFGYYNRNEGDTLAIPLGPDNYVEPAQFDGVQPTSFPPGREAGVFAITVPADFEGDVVWHLNTMGRQNEVPGRSTSPAYELSYRPMALGSVPPSVRFERAGAEGRGVSGLVGSEKQVRVGEPLELTVWAVDESVREREAAIGIAWYKHQGPGGVTFSDAVEEADLEGRATATATFSEPGEYMLRIRVDNFEAADSTPADQCCWTNAFQPVTVAQ
ncbi:MAG: hypothetical protein GEU90_00760 [Gemmatimonas sp.]|nr:hypothetical protein [Gemmatimonas sp.]